MSGLEYKVIVLLLTLELHFRDTNNNPNIHFLWIGDGELRSELTAPNIEVTGWFMKRTDGINKLNDVFK